MPERARIVQREDFVAAAKAGAAEGLVLRKAFASEVKIMDAERREIDFTISTAAVDRMRDSIAVEGWEYDNYLRSPVVLWAHDSSQPPIAKALSVAKSETALTSRAQFMDAELSRFADAVFRMYQKGFLTAVSVGFAPIEYAFVEDKDRPWGIDFKRQELLEYSCCPIPANPEALVAAKAAGIDLEPLRDWASKLLDAGGSVLVPRQLLEKTFKAAKTPPAVRRKYLPKESPTMAKPKRKQESEDDAPTGNCGRVKALECGMKDAEECAVHCEDGEGSPSDMPNCGREKEEDCGMRNQAECVGHKALKPRRRATGSLSDDHVELLNKALDHHVAGLGNHLEGIKCIKAVLDGNEKPDDHVDESLRSLADPERARQARIAAARKYVDELVNAKH